MLQGRKPQSNLLVKTPGQRSREINPSISEMFFLYGVRHNGAPFAVPFTRVPYERRQPSLCSRRRDVRAKRPELNPDVLRNANAMDSEARLNARIQMLKFLTGGIAGALAAVLVTPLDVIRTNIQRSGASSLTVAGDVLQNGGLGGLFRGGLTSAAMAMPAKSLSMQGYASFKHVFGKASVLNGDAVSLLAGMASGCVVALTMNPIAVIRTKLHCSLAPARFQDVAMHILKNEGLLGFYRGIGASLGMTTKNAFHFMVYEILKKSKGFSFQKHASGARRARFDAVSAGLAAGASKILATTITYPLDSIRVLMTTSPLHLAKSKYRTIASTLKAVSKESGLMSLYRGLGWELLGSVPKTIILFLTYEAISKQLDAKRLRYLNQSSH